VPVAASVFIYADPGVAEIATVVRVFQDDPGTGRMIFEFEKGEVISGVDHSVAGEHFVEVNQVRCTGAVDLIGRMETDVLVEIGADGSCEAIAGSPHDAANQHSIASVGGKVEGPIPPDTRVRIRSLSEPPRPVPDDRAPDEDGFFLFGSLLPARYRIELVANGRVLDGQDIELAPGAESTVTLQTGY
jgi:hypothetical protein